MSLYARIRQVVMVGGVETFGVALGGVAGLLIVNLLPKDQYAIYTFLLASMTLMTGISELGLSHCVLPVVGQRAGEQRWVVGVCHQIFHWRWLLLGVGVVLVLPYGYYSAVQHGWLGWPFLLAAGVMMGVVLLTLRDNFLHTVFLVLGHIATLNRTALAMHSVRFVLVAAVLLLPFGGFAMAGLFCATALSLVVAVRLQTRALATHHVADWRLDDAERHAVNRETLRIATPLVPSAIFFQVQGVVTVLIVSLFGTSDMMAEVGAFARLAMILTVLDRVSNMLLFPAIARATPGPRFVSLLLRVHGSYLGLMLLIFLSALFFPQAWMILLGRQYEAQTPYLWMAVGASILMNAAGFAFRTLTGRGATARQWFTIPMVLAVQVAWVAWAGVSSLPLVLGFNLATCGVHFAYQYALLVARLKGWRRSA